MRSEILQDFYMYTKDLLESDKVQSMEQYIQHGKVNCLQHSIGVAIFSLIFVRTMKMKCDERSLVRGALLHDYFLYDWHQKEDWHKLHGFHHASVALRNAQADFTLNIIEKDIIAKHMWPLNVLPPRYRESWVVNLVDTYCSTLETMGQIPLLRVFQNLVVNAGV